jgi:LEA14-like dessication related protein
MRLRRLFLLPVVLLLAGCTFLGLLRKEKFKAPAVAYQSAGIHHVTERSAQIDFTLKAKNPNSVGLQNVKVGYQLFYQDKRFLLGKDMAVAFAPRAETPFVIPTEVVYADVYAVSGALAQAILRGARTIPVRIDAEISGNPTLYDSARTGGLFPFTVHVSRIVEVPIPQGQIDKAKARAQEEALRRLKKRF